LSLNGILSVEGGINGNGSGGSIELLNNAHIEFGTASLNASGYGTGDGGQIHSENELAITEFVSLLANSGNAGGEGGSISIITDFGLANAVVLSTSKISISATGFDTGGTVDVDNATHATNEEFIFVNQIIKVDDAQSVSNSTFAGLISLNSVECVQYRVDNVFPKTYWDCVDGDPTLIPVVPNTATTLQSSLLTGANLQLYTMLSVVDWSNFFASAHGTLGVLGVTLDDPSTNQLVSTVFLNHFTGSGTASAPWPDSSTMHELGHAVDAALGGLSTTDSSFAAALVADAARLDAADCLDVFSAQTSICTDYPGPVWTNSKRYTKVFFDDASGNLPPVEMFARVFEHNLSNSGDPVQEIVLGFCTDLNSFITVVIATLL
jgi:hypothetical protein